MKIKITISIFLIAILIPVIGFSRRPYKFAVGFKGGTYESFAKILNEFPNLSYRIINSEGSGDIIKMVNRHKADFGIAQLDVLLNLDIRDSNLVKNVKFILPLYSEEVHIIANKGVRTVPDLAGKIISCGARNSGTAETALIVLDHLNMIDGPEAVRSMRFMRTKKGLEALQKGKIDAVFIVSGVPVKLLTKLPGDFGRNYHLLTFDDAHFKMVTKNEHHYKKAFIKPNDYPWIENGVLTIAVVSSIISHIDMSKRNVSNLINTIFRNRDKLEGKHPKWSELSKETIGWYLSGRPYLFHPAALKTLKRMGIRGRSLLSPE